MSDSNVYIAILFCIFATIALLVWIFKPPFKYPYKTITFDITGKRKPRNDDLIDNFLINSGFEILKNHKNDVEIWKNKCFESINKIITLKKIRTAQFNECVDDDNMFKFVVTRTQTRYKQKNYVKTPYNVQIVVDSFSSNFETLQDRFENLALINFECTLSEYHSKNQRKLMTKKLRNEIAERDNYTCQNCGKYMPDGVGLHIDHIIPIAKGGKSTPSNLQVLCSKCNGKKSKK